MIMSLNKKDTLLIVDDDFEIRNLLKKFLEQHDFNVLVARNGTEMFKCIRSQEEIHLIILDVMMPGADGFELCREVRKISPLPIIMLTAVCTEIDRVVGLELGADDYVCKPFNPRELLARVKAILRRIQEGKNDAFYGKSSNMVKYVFSRWILHKTTRKLFSVDDMEVNLSAGEYELLLAFVTHPLRILSRDQLLDLAKNRSGIPFDRSIDVQINRLRQKIEVDPREPELIKTVRCGGYMLSVPVEVQH
jgi:two-component system, OmpR family, response regulator